MPKPVRKIRTDFIGPSQDTENGKVVYLPNAQTPDERIAPEPLWKTLSPDEYRAHQYNVQKAMLESNLAKAALSPAAVSLDQQTQQYRLLEKWTQMPQQQQTGAQIKISPEELAVKQARQLAAQRAEMKNNYG